MEMKRREVDKRCWLYPAIHAFYMMRTVYLYPAIAYNGWVRWCHWYQSMLFLRLTGRTSKQDSLGNLLVLFIAFDRSFQVEKKQTFFTHSPCHFRPWISFSKFEHLPMFIRPRRNQTPNSSIISFSLKKNKKMFELFVCFWLDFGSSVRKLIGSKTSSPAAHDVSQLVNGSSATPPPRPSAASSKLSGYFQRSSSASSSALRRTNHPPLSSSLSGSSVALNGRLNQPSAPPPSVLPSDLCPSCLMPFDKNRKRRLIDSCGHERCYACLFSSELCPLCSPGSSTHVFAFLLVCLFVFGLGASWVTNTVWLEVGPAGGSGYLGSWNFENEERVSAICINSPSESFT